MHPRKGTVVSLAVVIVMLLSATAWAAGPAQQETPPVIYLAGASAESGGVLPDTPPDLTISKYAPDQRGYYVVQFRGPVEQAWKDEVAALGADILDYIPDFAFKVRMNPAQADRVAGLGAVARVGIFQPAYKLDWGLLSRAGGLYIVRVERGTDFGQARASDRRLRR